MSDTPQRRLILANGELYITPIERRGGGAPLQFPRSYAEARDHIDAQLRDSLATIEALPSKKKLGDEIILTLRLHPDATAKTYDPEALFRTVPDLQNVGSRTYHVAAKNVAQTARIAKQIEKGERIVPGRLVFVRSNRAGFERLRHRLASAQNDVSEAFQNDIRRIERFDLLTTDEQLHACLGDREWNGGRVELVFHPTQHTAEEQLAFVRGLARGSGQRKAQLSVYPEGPGFMSIHLERADLEAFAGVNLLRTAHPLLFDGFEDFRDASSAPIPPPPNAGLRSTIKVGMFDGGVDINLPHLAGYVEDAAGLSVKKPADARGIAHGSAVAGAMLYGPLNPYPDGTPLPTPPVSVVSVRVFPLSDPADQDLYEAIDIIENAVPARPDVLFWNISFGPKGPIFDDRISRFTYVLDGLAATHKVGFCVAVGNMGTRSGIWSRIQAPADLVNGLGVGSFTERRGVIMHAPYSCRGPGRECGKMKPDLVAFGGCDHTPFHVLSNVAGQKRLSHGTSVSSPLVTTIGGQAIGLVERGTALLARTLLIHTAKHPSMDPDYLLGHGLVQTDLIGLVRCDERTVTIVFQGDLLATKSVKLPIMLPAGVVTKGNVRVTWTVGALPPVNPIHPTDYTTMCIEDTFYPNSFVFPFQSPLTPTGTKVQRLHLRDDAVEIASLKAQGWKQSKLPVSDSGNVYATEHDKRALDFKWEPIVRRSTGKRATSLHDPFLVLHSIPRHGASGRVSYAAVVTIAAPTFEGDLYDAVLRSRPALQPIRLRSEAEVRIRI